MVYNKLKKIIIGSIIATTIVGSVCKVSENIHNIQTLKIHAAGKTVEAFKTTEYDDTSDAKVFYNRVKSYDSEYSGIYKEADDVKNSNFYNKSRTIKYWSSHGNTAGQLWGDASDDVNIDIFNDKSSFSWSGSNLEFVFLAACNQLNKEGSNPVKKYAKAMRGDKAVRVICGYHSYAPSLADVKVAKKFIAYAKTGESVKSSWMKANEYYYSNEGYTNCKNYAVLTHTGNVQYSRFPGFSSTTYTRPNSSSTEIIRFRRGVDTGEAIVQALSIDNNIDLQDAVPNYKLSVKNVKFKAKKKCDDMVFNDSYTISTDIGEFKSKEVSYTKEELYQLALDYYNDNLKSNSSQFQLVEEDMNVAPILSGNVNDDNEKIVGYSVSFQNKYDNISIDDNSYSLLVDHQGIKYTTLSWNDVVENPVTEEAISVEKAYEKAKESLDVTTDQIALFSTMYDTENEAKNVEIVFALNEETNYYEATYQFTFDNGNIVQVNCYDGKVKVCE